MQTSTFYIGDAANIMKTHIPDNSIHLTVTSPPYDKMRDYEGSILPWDDFCAIAKQLYRVTIPGGVVVWVVGDQTKDGSESLTSFHQAIYFKETCGFKMHDTMIYNKNGFANPSNNRYHQVFEYMFILVKGKLRTFNALKDRPNKYAGQTRWGKNTSRQVDGSLKVKKDTAPTTKLGMRFNVWKFNSGFNVSTSDKIAYDHPAIYPEKLAEDHIKTWSNPNEIVLDPLCGSGTTCKMAVLNNRQWIGIDKVAKYIEEVSIPRMKLYTNDIYMIVDKT